MNVLPVIRRELRVQARQTFTFTLRQLGVAAMLLAGLMFAIEGSFSPKQGSVLFGYLHVTLFCSIWILIPFSAADCLSRERREGTLGLLFLTALNARDIVVAKSVAHALRAATLLVAVIPVLLIPALLGGVSWQNAAVSALVNACSICWALAAALVASGGSKNALRAIIVAIALSIFGSAIFAYCLGILVGAGSLFVGGGASFDFTFLLGLGVSGIPPRSWSPLLNMIPQPQLLGGLLRATAMSLAVLALGIVIASRTLRRNWREEPLPAWMQRVQRIFCTPLLLRKTFNRWLRWRLERNPIGWLEQRSWSGRLVSWSWFAIVISLLSAVVSNEAMFRRSDSESIVGILLMLSMAASAAGSFRRERESGALELLLVSPLTSDQLILGRLRGLWGQFLPTIAVLLGISIYLKSLYYTNRDFLAPVYYSAVLFFTVPIVGLYFSLRCRHFLTAFVWTVASTLSVALGTQLALLILAILFGAFVNPRTGIILPGIRAIAVGTAQCLLGMLCYTALRRRLAQRRFPFERTAA